jgi:hypothetical protein
LSGRDGSVTATVDSGSPMSADAAILSLDAKALGPDAGSQPPDATASADSNDAAIVTGDAGPTALNVLFIGNSYTYVNDLPGMLAQIAATAGTPPTITTDEVVQGSATLQNQWDNGIAQTRIGEKAWTHVVLQGQSMEAAYPYDQNFATMALQFGNMIIAAGARPTLFVTWARAAADTGEYGPCASFTSPGALQDRITFGYADVARQLPGSILSCVGEAFRASLRDHPEIVLQQSDYSHPTAAGTYLAASTFYVALTGNPVPPASAVPAGVSAQDAELLREEALVGSQCADVQIKGDVWSQPCGKVEFCGAEGTPITQTVSLWNTGNSTAGMADGLTIAPPFEWTSGAYPGGSGTDAASGLPFCSASLAPNAGCVLSITYSGATEGSGTLTLNLDGAYSATLVLALQHWCNPP